MNTQLKEKKQKALLSIKKAYGITAKVLEMIEDDKYCPEIIQQIDAVIGLLNSSKKSILENHLNDCLEKKLHENRKETIEELLKIYSLGQK